MAHQDMIGAEGPKPAAPQADAGSLLADRMAFLLAAIGLSALASVYTWHYALVGWDDAWIYLRAARNVTNGFGPVMNPGDSHAVGTSLLWTYLLAGGHSLSGSYDLLIVARILTAAFTFGSCLLLSLVLRTTVGELGLLAPLALVSLGLLRGCAGLEAHLVVLAASVVLYCYFVRGSLPWTGAALGVAFFCRGDAILLGAPIALHALVTRVRRDRGPVSLTAVWHGVAAAGLVLGIGLVLHRLLTGEFLPGTMATKMIQGEVGPWHTYARGVGRYVLWALQGHWWFAGLALVGAILLGRTSMVLLGAAALHWAAYACLRIADYPWYSWLLQMSIGLCVVVGIGGLVRTTLRWLTHRRYPRVIAGAALAVSAALVAGILVHYGEVRPFASNPSLVDSGAVRTYEQVAGLLRDLSSRTTSGSPAIALCEEVGILSYECPDLVFRDINGIASPGLTRENLNCWQCWVEKYNPEFLVARGETPPARVYSDMRNHCLRAYRRVLLVRDPEFIPVSVYQRSDDRALDGLSKATSLQRLLLVTLEVEAPEARLLQLTSGRAVLLVPAPSRIRLTPPGGARRLSVGFGHSPLPAAARDRADGVVFRVVGVGADGREQELIRREQPAEFGADASPPTEVEVALDPGSCRELLLLVEPKGNTDWDWAYWSEVAFDRQ